MGIFNCDWLSFTIDFEGYNVEDNEHLNKLFNTLETERSRNDESGMVELGLFSFKVLNHGSRSYYFLLHNDDLEIRMARFRSKTEEVFPVYIHFKSQFLWCKLFDHTTLDDKFALVLVWLEDVLNCKYKSSKISRIDLAYHTDDVPADFNADNFVGRHTRDETIRTHRTTTAINIGSRKSQKLYLRCYNKYLEARASSKQWFYKIWEEAGMNIRKVWNIEFQIDRDFFSDFKVGRQRLDTVEEVLKQIPALWYYLTNDWITYRLQDNERRTRWSLHPWWTSIGEYHECKELVYRSDQLEFPTADALIPGLQGFITAYAARMGGNLDDGTLFMMLHRALTEYGERSGKSFDYLVGYKRQLMNPEEIIAEEQQKGDAGTSPK